MKEHITPDDFRKIRISENLTQQEMAKALGYESRSMISCLEQGTRQIDPRLQKLIRASFPKYF